MTDQNDFSESNDSDNQTPDDFIDEVRSALENLYDFPALQRHPLTRLFPNKNGEAPAYRLRRELINAIETLNPGHDMAVRSGMARVYNLMHLHYVGGMTLQESALELGISLRQVYRDLRRGQHSVSDIMWYSYRNIAQSKQASGENVPEGAQDHTPTDQPATQLSSLESELAHIEGTTATIDLDKTLATALRAIQRLAEQQSIAIETVIPQTPVLISTNPAIAQQVLIHLLSQTIQQVKPEKLTVMLESSAATTLLTLIYPHDDQRIPKIEPVIGEFMQQIHWKLQHRFENGTVRITVRISDGGAKILVVDDNEGLVNLLERFFTGLTYQVLSANNGEDGLKLAQETLPDVIIMDLMMPGMDGWELLQRLRTHEDTASIPVIICSVINDPELAFSLGAARFVSKPVNKDTLLDALNELKI